MYPTGLDLAKRRCREVRRSAQPAVYGEADWTGVAGAGKLFQDAGGIVIGLAAASFRADKRLRQLVWIQETTSGDDPDLCIRGWRAAW